MGRLSPMMSRLEYEGRDGSLMESRGTEIFFTGQAHARCVRRVRCSERYFTTRWWYSHSLGMIDTVF